MTLFGHPGIQRALVAQLIFALILKGWWSQGKQYDLLVFVEHNGLRETRMDIMVKIWETVPG
jgi:hypothetical protein